MRPSLAFIRSVQSPEPHSRAYSAQMYGAVSTILQLLQILTLLLLLCSYTLTHLHILLRLLLLLENLAPTN